MLKQDHYEQIEAFLSSQMSGAEQQAFEQNLAQNEALRQTLDLHRDMHDLYQEDQKDALRSTLQQMRKEFDDNGQALNSDTRTAKEEKKSTKWLRWIGLAFLLLLGVLWVLQTTAVSTGKEDTPEITTPIHEQSSDVEDVPDKVVPTVQEDIEESSEP
ncbi:MAG: hypothetical protein AAGJ93_02610, partial [Bacteroidota bacterium]